jgi:cytokinin dehydrogenase
MLAGPMVKGDGMSWTDELAKEISSAVLTDDASREVVANDFGRVVMRKPEAVVCPASTQEVAQIVKFAGRNSLSIATRGGGHSQSGQSLSNQLVLSMSSLNQLKQVGEGIVTVQAGIKWRALVEQLASQRLAPPVLTNNLDVSVGGTLSMGGLGVSSWRNGTQADNCLEIEVVTGTGEIVRCSAEKNRDLFDAVRCGCGQFGVITEAVLKVRRYAPRFRSFYLLYDDLRALLGDLKTLMTDGRFDYLESWCVPCPQGFMKVGGQRRPFAQWFFPLHVTDEIPEGAGEESAVGKLVGLNFYKQVNTEDGDMLEYFTRLDALFALWKRGGFWDYAHPWMECVLPWETTATYITQVLANLPPAAMVGGHILLWPALGSASKVPLFMRPEGEFLMGFGILPAVQPQFLNEVLPRLGMASQASSMMGGKRYLSGWINFDHGGWKGHYGGQWEAVKAAKQKFDPEGIMNPGFVKFD